MELKLGQWTKHRRLIFDRAHTANCLVGPGPEVIRFAMPQGIALYFTPPDDAPPMAYFKHGEMDRRPVRVEEIRRGEVRDSFLVRRYSYDGDTFFVCERGHVWDQIAET
jgi:hypothetical protein